MGVHSGDGKKGVSGKYHCEDVSVGMRVRRGRLCNHGLDIRIWLLLQAVKARASRQRS